MRNLFALTKAEQRLVIVGLMILVAIALVGHYRDRAQTAPARSTSSPTMAPSASPTPEEPLEIDDAP